MNLQHALARVAIGMIIAFSAASLPLMIAARTRHSDVDLISHYARFLEGPTDALEHANIACRWTADVQSATHYCVFTPESGPVARVTFCCAHGAVQAIVIVARPKDLVLGDLVLMWGMPSIERYGRWMRLHWPQQLALVADLSNVPTLNYWLPVERITFVPEFATS
jgi:hypothetical protein